MTPVIVRVDAGPGIGLGHLHRCLALAEGLDRLGASCEFLTPFAGDVAARIEAAGSPATALDLGSQPAGGESDLAQLAALAAKRAAQTLVIDSYAVTGAYLAALRAAGFRVIVIDDLAREPLPAHVVVNGGAQAPSLGYQSSTGDTTFLLGPAYALLRSDFRALPPRQIGPVRQVLITVGGDDPHGWTVPLIETVCHVPGTFTVVVAVGPFNAAVAAIEAAAARQGAGRVTVVRGARGLRDLIASSDVAISAAGQTLYELAATGTPVIAFELADNQSGSLAALAQTGAVKSAGRASEPGFGARLAALLEALMRDEDERRRLAAAGQALVDGRGADRVAAAVLGAR